jgi:hypothetical protein
MNIYVPSEAAEETLPVMFWIYGGGKERTKHPRVEETASHRVQISPSCTLLLSFFILLLRPSASVKSTRAKG